MSTNNHNNFYCRIEVFCFSNILLPGFIKERCFAIKDNSYYDSREEYDVCTKDFFDYQSVLDCLNIINEKFNNIKYQSQNTKQCESVLIYNKWRKSALDLSMYGDKWMFVHSSKLTNEWKENLDRFGREQKTVITHIPYCEEYDWCEFISKERVHLLVKDFLDRGDLHTDIIGDFDERKYHEYLDNFWQLWIEEDDESNKTEQMIELDNNLRNKNSNENLDFKILSYNFTEENNCDDINYSDASTNNNLIHSKEVDGQLKLFDLGLDI